MTFRKPRHDGPPPNSDRNSPASNRRSCSPQEPQYLTHPLIYLTTIRGNTIPAAYFHHPQAHFTILFSHGNGEDLGVTAPYALELSAALKVNVLCYDYSGYGVSTGRPSEANVYADIHAAYTYLVAERRICPSRILLFGRSLGSGPTIELASRLGSDLAGVVLIAALTSCVRVVFNSPTTLRFDMFANIDKIASIQAPVFSVHGMQDDVVPFAHGLELSRRARFPLDPYWVRDAGHNNLETGRFQSEVFERYISVLHQFKYWKAPDTSNDPLPKQSTESPNRRENLGALAKAAGCFGARINSGDGTCNRPPRRRSRYYASASGSYLSVGGFASGRQEVHIDGLWNDTKDSTLPRPASATETRSFGWKPRFLGIVRRGAHVENGSELTGIVR